MDLITLIGDSDQNFYQLGLKDKESGKVVHRDVKRMLSTSIATLDRTLQEIAKQVIKNSLLKKTEQNRHLSAYAEGLGIPLEEAFYIMLIPELVSAMSKWAPGFIKGNLGCSSFFMRNEKAQVVHGRILDFPLQGSYDIYERAILYDLNGMPKTLGFGAAGIPYPSITLMTEDGMTLALHQKFTNVFNKDGQSIFELITNLITNANDKKSVLDFLKHHSSLTTWCLYMSFKNGDILACDIMGKEIYSNEYFLEENKIIYFSNQLEDKTINQENFMPLGFHQYNLMRENIADKKINHFLKRKKHTEIDLIKMICTPYEQSFKHHDFSHYCTDPLTASSLSIMTMNPSNHSALYVVGEAPKVYRNNIVEISDAFSDPKLQNIHDKKPTLQFENHYQGLRSLMQAQIGFDKRDPQIIYHHLQFSIDHFENHIEQCVGMFYFLVAQYMYETHEKVFTTLLHDFRKLEGKLPQTLNDHCLLFIYRIEKILGLAPTLQIDCIKQPKLRDIYQLECNIPRLIFHFTTKMIIIPRIDIMDVIYIHTS